jgi:hypothetical protein
MKLEIKTFHHWLKLMNKETQLIFSPPSSLKADCQEYEPVDDTNNFHNIFNLIDRNVIYVFRKLERRIIRKNKTHQRHGFIFKFTNCNFK